MNMGVVMKPTKKNVENVLREYTGIYNLTEVSDNPSLWKHACPTLGVITSMPSYVGILGVHVYFYPCMYCGRVYYYKEGGGFYEGY